MENSSDIPRRMNGRREGGRDRGIEIDRERERERERERDREGGRESERERERLSILWRPRTASLVRIQGSLSIRTIPQTSLSPVRPWDWSWSLKSLQGLWDLLSNTTIQLSDDDNDYDDDDAYDDDADDDYDGGVDATMRMTMTPMTERWWRWRSASGGSEGLWGDRPRLQDERN